MRGQSPLTVVTGPPGTGKSYTITAIVLDALLSGQTVLVASQMDKAVEVVADMVERLAGRSPWRGPVAGWSSGNWLVSSHSSPDRSANLIAVATSAIKDCSRRHGDLTGQLGDLEQRFRRITELEQVWSQSLVSDRERLEPICTLPVQELEQRQRPPGGRIGRACQASRHGGGGLAATHLGALANRPARNALLQVPRDWDCSLDELDELARVQSLKLAMSEAERSLKPLFPADLVWEELADVERRRSATGSRTSPTLTTQATARHGCGWQAARGTARCGEPAATQKAAIEDRSCNKDSSRQSAPSVSCLGVHESDAV